MYHHIRFLAKPMVVLLASFYLEDSYRERAVTIILNTNTFLAFTVFLILTRPSNANKLFPFNVKTTQVCSFLSLENPIRKRLL